MEILLCPDVLHQIIGYMYVQEEFFEFLVDMGCDLSHEYIWFRHYMSDDVPHNCINYTGGPESPWHTGVKNIIPRDPIDYVPENINVDRYLARGSKKLRSIPCSIRAKYFRITADNLRSIPSFDVPTMSVIVKAPIRNIPDMIHVRELSIFGNSRIPFIPDNIRVNKLHITGNTISEFPPGFNVDDITIYGDNTISDISTISSSSISIGGINTISLIPARNYKILRIDGRTTISEIPPNIGVEILDIRGNNTIEEIPESLVAKTIIIDGHNTISRIPPFSHKMKTLVLMGRCRIQHLPEGLDIEYITIGGDSWIDELPHDMKCRNLIIKGPRFLSRQPNTKKFNVESITSF